MTLKTTRIFGGAVMGGITVAVFGSENLEFWQFFTVILTYSILSTLESEKANNEGKLEGFRAGKKEKTLP